MLREMRGPEGGFYSALDADSEGEEGRFYVWTPDADPRGRSATTAEEAIALLRGHRGAAISRAPTSSTSPRGAAAERSRERLVEARQASTRRAAQRVRPGLDDKRLASWNALAIAALAEAGAVLGRDDYLDAARSCAGFVLGEMRDAEGRLLRTYRTARPASTPTSRTTPSWSKRC